MAAASPLQAAQDDQSDTALPADCESLKSLSLPDADTPPASMVASLKGCSSEDLYFGIGVQKDPVRAPMLSDKIRTMVGPISSLGRAS
jgi:hypothetical protein